MTETPAQLIDQRIATLGDRRGETLAGMRGLIREAVPDVVEEWKWRGVPVWSSAGVLAEDAFKRLVRAAAKLNASKPTGRKPKRT